MSTLLDLLGSCLSPALHTPPSTLIPLVAWIVLVVCALTSIEGGCPGCGKESESSLHCFLQCPCAVEKRAKLIEASRSSVRQGQRGCGDEPLLIRGCRSCGEIGKEASLKEGKASKGFNLQWWKRLWRFEQDWKWQGRCI
ncbi:hypothetical protein AKJ16_DCAP16520 [Drosera capensis]